MLYAAILLGVLGDSMNMNIYVTKWWATKGILFICNAKIDEKYSAYGILHRTARFSMSGVRMSVSDLEFSETLADAHYRVAELAERKLRSLRKQIDKYQLIRKNIMTVQTSRQLENGWPEGSNLDADDPELELGRKD